MQSADIRLVYVAPSKSLALETDSLDYNTTEEQGHRNTKSITGDYDVDMGSATGLNLTAFDNLTLSQADFDPTYDDDDEDYESFVSQSKEPKEDETDDKSEDEVQLPSATADAMETYENITENIYCGSATGKSIAEESMPCECKYRPEKDSPDAACGDDNHCINRMMFMECMVDDCPCDRYCRNRRFQLRQYARVDVIRTEMKGFGLRALTDLPANAFIMEYIGEVIPNHEFIRRTKQYEAAGLQHYYFMTLKTDEIIDATKKGCLARFINHSCNPNCVTQKWVVGKNMRIGIFTKKAIQAGSELTFDYKFERYGAVAQPCYCGEPTCKGYIGGSLKTNHDSAKPSMVDGLDESGHIHSDDDDDDDDDEDSDSDEEESDVMSGNESGPDDNKKGAKHSGRKTMKEGSTGAVTLTQKKMLRKMHRRRASEPLQDPREVQSFVKRMLDSVGKSHLVIKLLQRLELTDASSPEGKEVLKKFVRLHGLKMLKFWLGEWKNDSVILMKVLQVLSRLPLANRNGLEDCKMLELISKLESHENPEIQQFATQLIHDWNQLKSVYRIPKRTTEPPSKIRRRTHLANEQDELSSQSSELFSRYDSSREFFDPDDDYFEYLSLDATAFEIQWKMEYPPHSVIPTAPRAMMDAYLKNGYYGYARHSPLWPSAYHSSAHDDTHSMADEGHDRSAYSSPYHKQSHSNALATTTAASVSSRTKEGSSGNTSPKLPQHWRYAYTEDGTIYYYNRLTGKTQWQCPEERVSSIEGVNQSDLEDLVERAIQDTENKRKLRSESPAVSLHSSHGITPSACPKSSLLMSSALSRSNSSDQHGLDENELKKEIGKIVTKYLSAKQKQLWNGDKHLFKELARKMTHHIVDREIQSSRKIQTINNSIRTKIEKFIDTHGADIVVKVQRKRKQRSTTKEEPLSDSAKFERVTPPSSLNTEVLTGSPVKRARTESIESQPIEKEEEDVPMVTTEPITESNLTSIPSNSTKPLSDTKGNGYYLQRENSLTNNPSRAGSPSYREMNRSGGYGRHYHNNSNYHHHTNNNNNNSGYYRSYHHPHHHYHSSPHHHYHSYHYPRHHRHRPPSPYYRTSSNRYSANDNSSRRSSPPPPPSHSHYYSRSSSRRGSLSDEDLDRRRWD